MKKILLSFICLAFLSSTVLFGQAQRRVLVESFTQASCGPCAVQNPGFNQLVFDNYDKVTMLKYQTSWPGFDPMNEHNPDEVQARVSYYGVTGVPNVHIDGLIDAGTSGSVTVGQIDAAYAVPTSIEMDLTHTVSSDLSMINIECVIKNVGAFEFTSNTSYARVAIIEKEIIFPEPPGSTSEVDFYHVMKKMVPDVTGTQVTSIPAGDSITLTFDVPLPDYFYNYNEVGVVAFLQDDSNQGVYQSEISEPQPLTGDYGDVGLAANTQGPSGFCEYELTPEVTLTNEGDNDITGFEVEYLLNGATGATETFSGTLAPGESTTVTFPTVSLDPGLVDIEYNVVSVNGLPDYNSLNDALLPAETFATLNDMPVFVEELVEGFEDTEPQETPENTIIVGNTNPLFCQVVNETFFQNGGLNWNDLGAYGESESSIMFGFWWWNNAGATASITFEKVDLSEETGVELSFDYWFSPYQFSTGTSNDGLIIEVSPDCGATWIEVFNESGQDLQTTAQATGGNSPQEPNASGWVSDTLDLSSFDNAAELVVRFTGVTDWGDNLYIDNINVSGEELVINTENTNDISNQVAVYPNPARENVNIELQLETSSLVTVEILDVTGKQVATIAQDESLTAGTYRYEWNTNTAPGVYFAKIRTANGEAVKKITVVK